MSDQQTLRSAANAPDHGQGPLGQVAHAVLAEHLGGAPAEPALHICQNTLPDPPFPMPGFVRLAPGPGSWEAAAGDLGAFVHGLAGALRAAPVPPPGSYGLQEQRMQRMLRYDAAAVCFGAHAVEPGSSAAADALAANLGEGLLHPGDLESSPGARPITVVWAADRTGRGVIVYGPPGGAEEAFTAAGVGAGSGDPVLAGLAEIARAQYDWTRAAFGLG
ncbi:hypothetical protein [Actinomadura parmotrematis]|uniref:Uncharacterized protein n=1 Tax=Actinomadura parmotrematis TaxID=2864039 RepID=A0ABS7FUN6_9ACTN|nr:hypothetical protein [Actinomadura parmotrematis]MBW8483675.1 hypothetical protein [Actinomadura parmotrematis]